MNDLASQCHATPRPAAAVLLDDQHRQTVQDILARHVPQARVFAFGSRVSGRPRKYSDLDLAISMPEPLSLRILRQLKDAFEDSNLPICVDIVDWSQSDDSFKAAVAAQGMSVLQLPVPAGAASCTDGRPLDAPTQ